MTKVLQSQKIPYGLTNGTIAHINDVPSGLACACMCPACHSSLVARKGNIRQHHFAHANSSNCSSGLETGLHLAAKEILESASEIILPGLEVNLHLQRIVCLKERSYKIRSVRLERKLETRAGDIIPDVIADIEGCPTLIEIFVTHVIDSAKHKRISALGCNTIEIDLSNAPRDFEPESLKALVLGSGSHKKWIYNYAVEFALKETFAKAKEMRITLRRDQLEVHGCPIHKRMRDGEPYATLKDCLSCRQALKIDIGKGVVVCGAKPRRKRTSTNTRNTRNWRL